MYLVYIFVVNIVCYCCSRPVFSCFCCHFQIIHVMGISFKQQMYFYVVILHFSENTVYYLLQMQSAVAGSTPVFFLVLRKEHILLGAVVKKLGSMVMLDSSTNGSMLKQFLQLKECLKMFLKTFQHTSIRFPLVLLPLCLQIKKVFFLYKLFSNVVLLHLHLSGCMSQIFVFISDNDKIKFICIIIANIF